MDHKTEYLMDLLERLVYASKSTIGDYTTHKEATKVVEDYKARQERGSVIRKLAVIALLAVSSLACAGDNPVGLDSTSGAKATPEGYRAGAGVTVVGTAETIN